MAQKKGGWDNPRSRKTKCNGLFVVYMLSYPNEKKYIGQDLTEDFNYFGSPDQTLIKRDLTPEQVTELAIVRKILWQSGTASDSEVDYWETEYILEHDSMNPEKGYSQRLPVTPTYEQRQRHNYWGGCRWSPTQTTN